MSSTLLIVEGGVDFFAALDLMHPHASTQWDVDVADGIPEGRIAIHVYASAGVVGALGGVFVYGTAFVYELHGTATGIRWRKIDGVRIFESAWGAQRSTEEP